VSGMTHNFVAEKSAVFSPRHHPLALGLHQPHTRDLTGRPQRTELLLSLPAQEGLGYG